MNSFENEIAVKKITFLYVKIFCKIIFDTRQFFVKNEKKEDFDL